MHHSADLLCIHTTVPIFSLLDQACITVPISCLHASQYPSPLYLIRHTPPFQLPLYLIRYAPQYQSPLYTHHNTNARTTVPTPSLHAPQYRSPLYTHHSTNLLFTHTTVPISSLTDQACTTAPVPISSLTDQACTTAPIRHTKFVPPQHTLSIKVVNSLETLHLTPLPTFP